MLIMHTWSLFLLKSIWEIVKVSEVPYNEIKENKYKKKYYGKVKNILKKMSNYVRLCHTKFAIIVIWLAFTLRVEEVLCDLKKACLYYWY